jgi:hypothetical protein
MSELSFNERIVLSNLSKKWCWIARDASDKLFLFKNRPNKNPNNLEWDTDTDYVDFSCYGHLFKFINWKDKEPYKISLLLEEIII